MNIQRGYGCTIQLYRAVRHRVAYSRRSAHRTFTLRERFIYPLSYQAVNRGPHCPNAIRLIVIVVLLLPDSDC